MVRSIRFLGKSLRRLNSLRQHRAQSVNDGDNRKPNSSGDHAILHGCRCFFDKSPELHEHRRTKICWAISQMMEATGTVRGSLGIHCGR